MAQSESAPSGKARPGEPQPDRDDQALAEARRRVDSALLAGKVGTFDWDILADRMYCDANFARIFGVRLDDSGQFPIADYLAAIHPDDRAATQEKVERSIRTGGSYEAEYRIVARAAAAHPALAGERWVVARGRVERNERGEAVRFPGVVIDVTERKSAEAALRERDELFRTIFNQAPDDAILVIDVGRIVTAWNPAAERLTGWTAEEAVGGTADLIFTPEDRAAGIPVVEAAHARREGKAADERWHLRKDGSRFWGSGTMNALHDAGGQVRGYLKVFRDVTERHIEAEMLAFLTRLTDAVNDEPDPDRIIIVAEQMLGEHLKASRVLLAETTSDGDRLLVSHEYSHGMPSVIGAYGVADFGPMVAADVHSGRTHVSRHAEGQTGAFGPVASIAVPVMKEDRLSALVVVQQSTPRDWTAGEVALVRQATERLMAEIERARYARSLRESESRLARQKRFLDAALSSVSDFTYTFDRAGRFTFVSSKLLALWGLTLEQAIGKNFFDLQYPPDLAARLQRQIEEVYQTRMTLTDTTDYTSPSGQPGSYEYTFTPVLAPDGSVGEVAGVTRETTERKRFEREREQILEAEQAARAEAERQGRMKDDFLATLSHELRTPLNAIVGWTQILKTGGSPEDIAEGISVIERNARAQTQIIEDILDMSRIISGKLRLDVKRVDMIALVKAGIDTVQPAADARGVRLEVQLDPSAGDVSGDPNRLQQVIWNLLSNAVKFTPKNGRVRVLLECVNSHVQVSVIDTGEGIDPAFLPFVFDRFRQADASTTRKHGGLGLGLAIVKQLVELHGGSVRVKSEGQGQGATFIVSLPLTAMQSEHAAPEPVRGRSEEEAPSTRYQPACRQLEGIRVIVVDDEPDGRAAVKRLLEDCGAIVRTASSTSEALRLLAKEVPSVLLSDIGMPGEDGYSLIRRVRSLPRDAGGAVPAIALTAYARAADRVRVMEAGFQMHLAKPVEPAELIATVASIVKSAAAKST